VKEKEVGDPHVKRVEVLHKGLRETAVETGVGRLAGQMGWEILGVVVEVGVGVEVSLEPGAGIGKHFVSAGVGAEAEPGKHFELAGAGLEVEVEVLELLEVRVRQAKELGWNLALEVPAAGEF